MTTKSTDRARRFTNESNGRKLVQAVHDFRSQKGWPNMNARGFWEAFAGWAAAQEDLRPWTASGTAWGARYRRAEFRFSPAGDQQAAEVVRVTAAAQAAHVSVAGLWAAIGGTRDAASAQLNAERPWAPGALGRLAERLGVPEASLRGPAAPMQEPLRMDPRRRRVLAPAGNDRPPPAPDPSDALVQEIDQQLAPGAPPIPAPDPVVLPAAGWDAAHGLTGAPFVQRATAKQGDLAAAVADAEELRRLRRVFRLLDRLARMGARLDNRDLREIVGYGRGRDVIDSIMADRLAETRKTIRGVLDEMDDGDADGEGSQL